MSRRFQFSLRWGVVGALFGAVIGLAICRWIGADQHYSVGASLTSALVFGALGCFFGDQTVSLIFEVLSYLSS